MGGRLGPRSSERGYGWRCDILKENAGLCSRAGYGVGGWMNDALRPRSSHVTSYVACGERGYGWRCDISWENAGLCSVDVRLDDAPGPRSSHVTTYVACGERGYVKRG